MSQERSPEYYFNRAKLHGLNLQALNILVAIVMWFNGHPVTIDGERRSIGTHHEPTLHVLVDSAFESASWNDEWQQAFEELQDRGYLRSEYIAGRKVDWAITEKGRRAIQDILKERKRHYPTWADEDREGQAPPLFGDGNELLEHRKGVEVMGHLLKLAKENWDEDYHEGIHSITYYPRPHVLSDDDEVHQLDISAYAGGFSYSVEVLTGNNNREHWVSKIPTEGNPRDPRIWVFPNRETMVAFFNTLNETDALEFEIGDGFTGDPSNWSNRAVNDRLDKYRSVTPTNETVGIGWTLPALLHMDFDEFEDMIFSYYPVW